MGFHEAFGQRVDLVDGIQRIVFVPELSYLYEIIDDRCQIQLLNKDRMRSFLIVNKQRAFFDVSSQSLPCRLMRRFGSILADKKNMSFIVFGTYDTKLVSSDAFEFQAILMMFLL